MDWFLKTFLPSFGKCQGKRISEKQFNIFRKYLDKNEYIVNTSNDRYTEYFDYLIVGKRIRLQDSLVGYKPYWHEYYLTIK